MIIVPFSLEVSVMVGKSLWEDGMRSKIGFWGSFCVQKGAWKLAAGLGTLGIGTQLSKYWNIYWRLIPSLSIGRIYGILLDCLSMCPLIAH